MDDPTRNGETDGDPEKTPPEDAPSGGEAAPSEESPVGEAGPAEGGRSLPSVAADRFDRDDHVALPSVAADQAPSDRDDGGSSGREGADIAGSGDPAPVVRPARQREPLPLAWASLLSLAGGALYVLSVPKTDVAPLAWFSLVPLFLAVDGAGYRRVFWCSWLFGLATNIGGFPWVTTLLTTFGHLPFAAAAPLHGLFGAYQGLMFPVAALGAAWLRRSGVPLVVAWVAGFLLSDYLFPMVFPWYLAMSQYRFLAFVQAADLVGVVGLTSLVVAVNVAAYVGVRGVIDRWWPMRGGRGERWWALGGGSPGETAWTIPAVTVVMAATLAYGAVQLSRYRERRSAAEPLAIGVVQPNVGIYEKRDSDRQPDHLARLQRLTAEAEAAGARAAVWPETAYPYALSHDAPEAASERLDFPPSHPARIRRGFGIPLVFGVQTRSVDPFRRYNSAFVLDARNVLHGPADKNHLLVFGEYLPLRDSLPFLGRWFRRSGHFTPGDAPGLLPLGNLRLGMLNCYEDILPRYVGDLVAAGPPHLLVNLTNDAWFGDSAEPHQHLALAVFRCVEQRREMVRAVNTGVSAHVAATGEILHRTGTFVEDVFVAEVVPYGGRTIYGRLGDLPGYLALFAIFGWGVRLRLRRRGDRPGGISSPS